MAFKGLIKTAWHAKIASLFASASAKDYEETLSELEELLILADISLPVVGRIMAGLRKKTSRASPKQDCLDALKGELLTVFPHPRLPVLDGDGKNVILLVGVNGSGKTTSAAKLARYFQLRGKKVLMAAADTFRAAGATQLALWGQKLSIPVVCEERGADPGSVVFNSMQSWQNKDFDLLIIDTAGRMQSKENLMRELQKIVKIIKKFSPLQPAETWLVLDASTGQNALAQAEKFSEFSAINGLLLAKLDGTAKGGTVISIADRLGLPVRYAGIGEAAEDLWEFSEKDFVESLLRP
ncbi:MAG: signal recognition particle-docking protein FtsY [Candidatus Aminicenantes bacterium]|nr:signal recognition particle-docking protein FtsY [Candidatus Aminicenantes bacterium]